MWKEKYFLWHAWIGGESVRKSLRQQNRSFYWFIFQLNLLFVSLSFCHKSWRDFTAQKHWCMLTWLCFVLNNTELLILYCTEWLSCVFLVIVFPHCLYSTIFMLFRYLTGEMRNEAISFASCHQFLFIYEVWK